MKTFVSALFLSYCVCLRVCVCLFVCLFVCVFHSLSAKNGGLGNVHISSVEPFECVSWKKKRKVAKLVTCETLELRVGSRVGVLCLSFESKMWTSFGSSKERSLQRIISIVPLS
jgi:hypothetical protein